MENSVLPRKGVDEKNGVFFEGADGSGLGGEGKSGVHYSPPGRRGFTPRGNKGPCGEKGNGLRSTGEE